MADATSRRWINVGVSDPRIQYSGTWISDSYTNPGTVQAPGELNTGLARGVNTSGSFSFQYEGVCFLRR